MRNEVRAGIRKAATPNSVMAGRGPHAVIAGLDPAIQGGGLRASRLLDARIKSGHDGGEARHKHFGHRNGKALPVPAGREGAA